MKRIYLTGAALILLVLLAVSYFNIRNKPASGASNKFTANTQFPSPANTITETPVDNAPAPPVVTDEPLQVYSAAYVTPRRHRAKHAHHTQVVCPKTRPLNTRQLQTISRLSLMWLLQM